MKTAAIIGLGTMGPGMAARLARGGIAVRGFDTAPEAVPRAQAMLPAIGGVLDRLGIADRGGGIAFPATLEEAVRGADLVIENVPERIEAKEQAFRAIEPLLAPGAILASDTSGIPITRLQACLAAPARLVGMHWSNPPHIIPVIEVIPGAHTAPGTAEAVEALIRDIGLIPVRVKKDVPGFVENRVLYALLRECVELVERGVIEPEGLDAIVSWGIGYKLAVVGPMALLDMAGLDIYRSVASYLNADLSANQGVSPMVEERVAAGRLGIKTAAGLFDYTPERIRDLQAERARRLVAARLALESKP
jgi:3-hydroxybutyryl-CoA dehydrogenase/5-formyl-3-hydroxy-2-methylpyridine 4-carboxylate dehydrogenase